MGRTGEDVRESLSEEESGLRLRWWEGVTPMKVWARAFQAKGPVGARREPCCAWWMSDIRMNFLWGRAHCLLFTDIHQVPRRMLGRQHFLNVLEWTHECKAVSVAGALQARNVVEERRSGRRQGPDCGRPCGPWWALWRYSKSDGRLMGSQSRWMPWSGSCFVNITLAAGWGYSVRDEWKWRNRVAG